MSAYPTIINDMETNVTFVRELAEGDENGDQLWSEDYMALDHINGLVTDILVGNVDSAAVVDLMVRSGVIVRKGEWA